MSIRGENNRRPRERLRAVGIDDDNVGQLTSDRMGLLVRNINEMAAFDLRLPR